jgi:hypothetical protein
MSKSKQYSAQVNSRGEKRARFVTPDKKEQGKRLPRSTMIWVGGAVVLLVVIIAVIVLGSPKAAGSTNVVAANPTSGAPNGASSPQPSAPAPASATSGHDPYPQVFAENGVVSFPISTFADGKARFYTYMNGDKPIEFFVLRSKDGTVRAAFNACDVCFGAKKGYRQEGDVMVCNNCGSRFPADKINEVRGGCNPGPLTRTVQGDNLIIKVEDIVAGQTYF